MHDFYSATSNWAFSRRKKHASLLKIAETNRSKSTIKKLKMSGKIKGPPDTRKKIFSESMQSDILCQNQDSCQYFTEFASESILIATLCVCVGQRQLK